VIPQFVGAVAHLFQKLTIPGYVHQVVSLLEVLFVVVQFLDYRLLLEPAQVGVALVSRPFALGDAGVLEEVLEEEIVTPIPRLLPVQQRAQAPTLVG
jgi:hypothetical protein